MYKYLIFIAKPEGESADVFNRRYLDDHTQRVLALPGVERYIANIIEPIPDVLLDSRSGFGNPGSGVDAVDEIWMEDEEFPIKIYAEEDMAVYGGYQAIEFEGFSFVSEKKYPLGKRTPLYKRLAFLARLDGMTREEFSEYWREKHNPLTYKIHINAFDRYVQNHICGTLTPETKEWDGIVQDEFFSPEEFAEGFFSAVPNGYELMLEDTHKFIGRWHENRPAFLMREYVMKR